MKITKIFGVSGKYKLYLIKKKKELLRGHVAHIVLKKYVQGGTLNDSPVVKFGKLLTRI